MDVIFSDDQLKAIADAEAQLPDRLVQMARGMVAENLDRKKIRQLFKDLHPRARSEDYVSVQLSKLKHNEPFQRLVTLLRGGVLQREVADRAELERRWTARSRGPEELFEREGIIEWRLRVVNLEEVMACTEEPRQVMSAYLVDPDPGNIPAHLAKYVGEVFSDGRVTFGGHEQTKDRVASEKLLAQSQALLVDRQEVQAKVITATVDLTPDDVKNIGRDLENEF